MSENEKEDKEAHSPILAEINEKDVSSFVAVAGHPVHAMMVHFPIALVFATLGCDIFFWWSGDPFWARTSVWSAGFAFCFGIAAGIAGTAELVAVPGIRGRVGSWTHAIAAMMLLAVAGTNWGLRLVYPDQILPLGLGMSVLASLFTALAGWHGGKLVFDHGVGIMVSPDE